MTRIKVEDAWLTPQFECPVCGTINDLDESDFNEELCKTRCESCDQELTIDSPY